METRYYDSQVYLPENELSAADVSTRKSYVKAHFSNGAIERAEVVINGSLNRVVYYRDVWSEVVGELHRELYDAVPYRVSLPDRRENGADVRDVYICNKDGALVEIERSISSADGWIQQEDRLRPDGSVMLTAEYAYNDEGEIVTVTTRDGSGKVLSVEKSTAS